jgi:hypothetical protein
VSAQGRNFPFAKVPIHQPRKNCSGIEPHKQILLEWGPNLQYVLSNMALQTVDRPRTTARS